jgi:LysR family glycine cleavage system transcriptional activator
LYAVIRRSFSDIDEEMRTILDRSGKPQIITIRCAPSFAAIWIMPRLPAFLLSHPGIDVRLWAVYAPPAFATSGVDIAITYGRPQALAGVKVEPIAPDECYLPHFPGGWIERYAPGCRNFARGLRLDRAFMTLNAAGNGLGMCVESTVLVKEYLQQGRLVLPFGDMGLSIMAHYLAVPKCKERLGTVQTVLHWIKLWMSEETPAGSGNGIMTDGTKQAAESNTGVHK